MTPADDALRLAQKCERLLAIESKATPGPWIVCGEQNDLVQSAEHVPIARIVNTNVFQRDGKTAGAWAPNADFIVALRNALPSFARAYLALLAEKEQLQKVALGFAQSDLDSSAVCRDKLQRAEQRVEILNKENQTQLQMRKDAESEAERLRTLLRKINDNWALHGISTELRKELDAAAEKGGG